VQFDIEAGLRDLPGSLGSRQAAADDVDRLRVHAHFPFSCRSGALRSGAGDFARAQKGIDAKGPHHEDEKDVDRHARKSLPGLVELLPLTQGSRERDQREAQEHEAEDFIHQGAERLEYPWKDMPEEFL
jgi:hypothetical protein